MNVVSGNDSALVRLYWAEDNLVKRGRMVTVVLLLFKINYLDKISVHDLTTFAEYIFPFCLP